VGLLEYSTVLGFTFTPSCLCASTVQGLSHYYRKLLKVAGRICRVVPGSPAAAESNPNPDQVGL